MRRLMAVVVSLVCLASADLGRAEEAVELWRSPYGWMWSGGPANVDPRDGSIWFIDGLSVTHLAADGATLFHSTGLAEPVYLYVDTANGSCWVYLRRTEEVLHLGPGGEVLSLTPGFAGVERLDASRRYAVAGLCYRTWVRCQYPCSGLPCADSGAS